MIDPRGMNLLDWADSVSSALQLPQSIGRLDDPAGWQDWAAGLVRASNLTQRSLPNPYQFEDWREWATRAYPLLEGTA